jgi:putative membrane protein
VSVLPLVLVLVAALLYASGRGRIRPWRAVAFAAALASTLAVLEPPVHGLADKYLWAHMTQHVVLMMLAAPLLLLAAPWMRIWRAFPLEFRRPVARTLVLSRWWTPVRAVARVVATPVGAWVLFNADMGLWHVPRLYDLTVRNQAVHDLEHFSFLVLGLVFWAQVIDSPPFHCRLDYPRRVAFLVLGGAAGWVLAVVLALAPSPLYAAYGHGHGGLSPVGDQQLAAGVMWGLGSIPFAIGIFYFVYRWLGASSEDEPLTGRLAGEHF